MMGGEFPYDIISALPWERRDYVAEGYGQGRRVGACPGAASQRVLIAGDAAHQFSPTGGIGMHTGLEDAVNLAWKLTAMLQGWGGDTLVASYEQERRPIAVRNAAISTSTYKALVSIPPHGRGRDWQADMSVYSLPDQFRSNYPYDGSPQIVPDGSPAPVRDGKTFVVSARPGERAPHAWLDDGRSTLDHIGGSGFTLFRLGPSPPDATPLLHQARRRGVPIRQVDIAEPAVRHLYEASLVLIRPDFHVAWRGTACPADPAAVIDQIRGAS